jgi:phosphatidylglycerol---prolipoprotein diacylglyceryl transferase
VGILTFNTAGQAHTTRFSWVGISSNNMRPVLFTWRGITIHSYPAMLYIGLVLGVIAENLVAHANRIDALRVYIATLILIVPALGGARLLYVAAEWPIYRDNRRRIWDRRDGGYIMYGGLPASLLVSVPLLRILHLSIPAFWDVAIFTILIGMFFTRIGCLLNGCCAGKLWRFGLHLPNANGVWEKRIPTQLMESAWAAALIGIALVARLSAPFPGAVFLLVCFGYAAGRLLMDFARDRETNNVFSIARVISIAITLLSFSALTFYWRR